MSFLKEAFPQYTVKFSDDFTCATIINPFYNENINVYYEESDDYTPFIACFSFQHRHLTEIDVLEWCTNIINERIFAIEFFYNEQRRFGSEIIVDELIDLSYEKLEQFTEYYGSTKLFECANSFKIRAWNHKHSFDAKLVCANDGNISIEKTYI